jgi:phosphoribosyl-dephospho-CoA transferase
MPEAPRRHELVWLAPSWASALAAPLASGEAARVAAWVGRGLPLVARRRDARLPGTVGLGLALPPGGPLRRVALSVHPAAVARVAPPLTLRVAARSAPTGWRRALRALDHDAREARLLLRVYGSLAWQHLSHDPFVQPGSDVDLLVRPEGPLALERALALLGARADLEPRLDGEVLLGDVGVSWRELLARPERVLVKGPVHARLEPLARVLGRVGEAA